MIIVFIYTMVWYEKLLAYDFKKTVALLSNKNLIENYPLFQDYSFFTKNLTSNIFFSSFILYICTFRTELLPYLHKKKVAVYGVRRQSVINRVGRPEKYSEMQVSFTWCFPERGLQTFATSVGQRWCPQGQSNTLRFK